jgi:hypothetical protein
MPLARMRHACMAFVGASGVAALVLTSAAPAAAQSNNRVAAEALFKQARKLLDAGQYAEACEKLAASEELDPAVGTLLNLAHCYEKIGKTATAWSTYRDAIAAAKASGQSERARVALRAADALEPALPRLTINLSPQASAARPAISRDGVAVLPELWGVTVPVDPGDHSISATAAGKKPWSSNVRVEERASQSVDVPALESAPPDVAPAAPTPPFHVTASQAAPVDQVHEERPPFWNGKRIAGTALLSVGVAGAVVAVAEGLAFKTNVDQESSLCKNDACAPGDVSQSQSLLGQARTDETVGIIAGVGGGVAVVVGAILWLTSGRGESASASAFEIRPMAGPRELGLGISGAL